MSRDVVRESAISIVSEGTRVEGKAVFDQFARIHGVIQGEVHAAPGSRVILAETGMIEGTMSVDHIVIDGFVQGDITARTRVVISRTGRVIGDIRTPSLQLEFGAYFEGRCEMEKQAQSAQVVPAPVPALSPT